LRFPDAGIAMGVVCSSWRRRCASIPGLTGVLARVVVDFRKCPASASGFCSRRDIAATAEAALPGPARKFVLSLGRRFGGRSVDVVSWAMGGGPCSGTWLVLYGLGRVARA